MASIETNQVTIWILTIETLKRIICFVYPVIYNFVVIQLFCVHLSYSSLKRDGVR